MMTFAEAMAFLERHINREAVAGAFEGLSLDVMEGLLGAMGDPHRSYPSIHITGTKGKGTTVRLVAALLAASGLTAGQYTSPHVSSITERLARNDELISPEAFGAVVGDVAQFAALVEGPPSYFELLTAAAFQWFSDEAVDAAVVEVGLLGRFDATNVIESSVQVITTIGLDHTDGAPGWEADVMGEKAGIIVPGSPVVLGPIDDSLIGLVEAESPSAIHRLGVDIEVTANDLAVGGRLTSFHTPWGDHDDIFVSLHGRHQADNAAVAVATVEAFFDRPLDDEVIVEALSSVSLPGRFEVVAGEPMVVLDGAHNPDSLKTVARTMRDDFPSAGRYLVVGMLGGRDPGELLLALEAPLATMVIACAPDSARAIPAADVAEAARALGCQVETIARVDDAVERALSLAEEHDAVVVTGSFYTVGEARRAIAAP